MIPHIKQRKEMNRKVISKITLFVLLFLMLFSCPGIYAFETRQTGLFTFNFYQDSRSVQYLIDHADAIAADISMNTGFEFRERVTVFIAEPDTFRQIQPAGARVPDWAAGVAYPSKNLIYLKQKQGIHLIRVFRHEVSHILLGQAFRELGRVPRWLDEGIAMLQADEWSMGRLSTMTFAVLTDSLIPMDELAKSFPRDARQAELAYCQSYYFLTFLIGEFGLSEFHKFMNIYSTYGNFELALRRAYLLDWFEIEELWLKYLALRFSWIPLITSASTLWFAASILFIIGYISKKKRARDKLKQWEQEETACL